MRNAIYSSSSYNGPSNVAASQYLGCYLDDSKRDIKSKVIKVKSFAECQSKCTNFLFFAMQLSECRCSNTFASNPDIYIKKNDTDCGGSSNKAVGSQNRNAIYKNPDYNGDPIASRYIGCYTDIKVSDITSYASSGPPVTLENCFDMCQGYAYAAVQNSLKICTCGNSYGNIPVARKVFDGECFDTVYNTTVGKKDRNAIYLVGSKSKPFPVSRSQYLGCYNDDRNRDLDYVTSINGLVNGLANCQINCNGYNYFALQSTENNAEGTSNYCFCGNSYATKPHYVNVPDSECLGKIGSSKGSIFRNAIYRHKDYNGAANVDITAPPSSYNYIGCYADSIKRDFAMIPTIVETIIDCQKLCVQYSYFGLQIGIFALHSSGIECRCTNTYNNTNMSFKVDDTECWGKAGYSMGGANRNAIYSQPNVGIVTPSQYVGCYFDDITRDIAPKPTYTRFKTLAGCQDVCKGSNYFALQGDLCFCGNKYATQPRYMKLNDSECGGIVGNSVGKPFRNAIYRHIDFTGLGNIDVTTVAPKIPYSQYIGCYLDNFARDLKFAAGSIIEIGECQSRCNGYVYFAVQGGLCFCGNAYATAVEYKRLHDLNCTFSINGVKTLWGNKFTSAIYRHQDYLVSPTEAISTSIASVSKDQFLGCYFDDNYRDIAPTYTYVN